MSNRNQDDNGALKGLGLFGVAALGGAYVASGGDPGDVIEKAREFLGEHGSETASKTIQSVSSNSDLPTGDATAIDPYA